MRWEFFHRKKHKNLLNRGEKSASRESSVELLERCVPCSISAARRHRCEPAAWLPAPDPRIPPPAGPCTPRSCWGRTWPVSSGCTYRMCTQGTTFNFSFVLSHVRLLSFSFLFFLFCVFYPDRLAAIGGYSLQFALAHLLMFALVCSRATFRRVLQPISIEKERSFLIVQTLRACPIKKNAFVGHFENCAYHPWRGKKYSQKNRFKSNPLLG